MHPPGYVMLKGRSDAPYFASLRYFVNACTVPKDFFGALHLSRNPLLLSTSTASSCIWISSIPLAARYVQTNGDTDTFAVQGAASFVHFIHARQAEGDRHGRPRSARDYPTAPCPRTGRRWEKDRLKRKSRKVCLAKWVTRGRADASPRDFAILETWITSAIHAPNAHRRKMQASYAARVNAFPGSLARFAEICIISAMSVVALKSSRGSSGESLKPRKPAKSRRKSNGPASYLEARRLSRQVHSLFRARRYLHSFPHANRRAARPGQDKHAEETNARSARWPADVTRVLEPGKIPG